MLEANGPEMSTLPRHKLQIICSVARLQGRERQFSMTPICEKICKKCDRKEKKIKKEALKVGWVFTLCLLSS